MISIPRPIGSYQLVSEPWLDLHQLMVVTTRSIMDNRIELVEQKTSVMEATMEQMRQMMVELHSRPQISLDQVRQLIVETQPRRRQGRNRNDEEDEWSDQSADSSGSRRRTTRNNGGHRLGLGGSRRRLEIPIFKWEDAYGCYFRLNETRVQDKVDTMVWQ